MQLQVTHRISKGTSTKQFLGECHLYEVYMSIWNLRSRIGKTSNMGQTVYLERSVFYCPHLRYRWPLTLNFTYCLCICKAGRQLGLEDLFLGTLHQLVAAVTPPHVDLTGLRHQGRLPCLYAVWADTGAGVVWCHSTYLREHFKDCMNTKTSGRVLDSKHCSNCISSVWIHLQ